MNLSKKRSKSDFKMLPWVWILAQLAVRSVVTVKYGIPGKFVKICIRRVFKLIRKSQILTKVFYLDITECSPNGLIELPSRKHWCDWIGQVQNLQAPLCHFLKRPKIYVTECEYFNLPPSYLAPFSRFLCNGCNISLWTP